MFWKIYRKIKLKKPHNIKYYEVFYFDVLIQLNNENSITINITTKEANNIIPNPNQRGKVTIHHDQLITLHNFNVIKINPNKLIKLIPLFLIFLPDILLILNLIYIFKTFKH